MNPRLTALNAEFNELETAIATINRTAANENRDLNAEEKAKQQPLLDRVKAITPEIEKLGAEQASMASVRAILDRVNGPGGVQPTIERAVRTVGEPAKLTAGEYLAAAFDKMNGHVSEAQFLDRVARYIDRAGQASTDTLGLLPQPIVGEVLKLNDARRPVFASFSQRTMPGLGRKFDRPRVSQRAQVGEQAAELDPFASQKMTVTFDEVTKRTVGGYLELAQQAVEWSDPAALDILVADFVDLYVEFTEGLACTKLVALATNESAYDATTIDTLVASYINGVVAAYNLSKRNPDKVWLDLASWATLASTMTESENRSAIAVLREALNELGTPVDFVVGPQLAADTRIIGTSTLLEAYEKQNGLLSAQKVSTHALEIGYSGYVAFHGLEAFGVALVVEEP